MAKYVVTGGLGFIGSWVQDYLTEDGHDVHVIDTLVRGEEQLKNLDAKATLHRVDIRKFDDVVRVFDGADGVFHLAALPRMQYSIEQPILTNDVNVNGTLVVLEAARQAGVRRVVYSASSSAYGTDNDPPFVENMEARPRIPYAVQKFVGELNCASYSEIFGLETVCLRYFNVYGPRQTTDKDGAYATVIGIFLGQREKNQPMTVVYPGTQSRDFTYVSDVADANLKAMLSEKVGNAEIINIGTGKTNSIQRVAKMIGGETVVIGERIGEARETRAIILRARKLLDWQPTTPFDEGMLILKQIHGLV